RRLPLLPAITWIWALVVPRQQQQYARPIGCKKGAKENLGGAGKYCVRLAGVPRYWEHVADSSRRMPHTELIEAIAQVLAPLCLAYIGDMHFQHTLHCRQGRKPLRLFSSGEADQPVPRGFVSAFQISVELDSPGHHRAKRGVSRSN